MNWNASIIVKRMLVLRNKKLNPGVWMVSSPFLLQRWAMTKVNIDLIPILYIQYAGCLKKVLTAIVHPAPGSKLYQPWNDPFIFLVISKQDVPC